MFFILCVLTVLFLNANTVYAQLRAGQTARWLNVRNGASCLTATSDSDGAAVVFQSCGNNVTAANSWIVNGGDDEPGTIQIFGNKCLDVKDGINADGTKLQIWTCAAGNTNQQFKVTGQQISWVGKNKCVDLTNGSQAYGNIIQVWTCFAGNTNQQWVNQGVNIPTSVKIQWKSHPNLCVTGSSNTPSAKVVLDSCTAPTGAGNNTWYFVGGTEQVATYNNMCLSITRGSVSDGTKLVLTPCENHNAGQVWKVNTGIITSLLVPQSCLDVTDGSSAIGTQMQIWTCNLLSSGGDNANQDFIAKFTWI